MVLPLLKSPGSGAQLCCEIRFVSTVAQLGTMVIVTLLSPLGQNDVVEFQADPHMQNKPMIRSCEVIGTFSEAWRSLGPDDVYVILPPGEVLTSAISS